MKHKLQGYVAEFGAHIANAFDLTAWQLGTSLRHFGVGLRVTHGRVRVELRHLMSEGRCEVLAALDAHGPGEANSPPFFLKKMDPGLLQFAVVSTSKDAEFTLFVGTDDTPARAYQRIAYLCHSETARKAHAASEAFQAYQKQTGQENSAFLVLAREVPSADKSYVTALPGPARETVNALVLGHLAEKNATHVCSFGGQPPHPEMFLRTEAFMRFANRGLRLGAPVYPRRWLTNRPDIVGATGTTDGTDDGIGLSGKELEGFVDLGRMPDSAPAGWDCVSIDDMQGVWLGEYGPSAIVPMSMWVCDDGTATTARLTLETPRTPSLELMHKQLIEAHRKIDQMREELSRYQQAERDTRVRQMRDMGLQHEAQVSGDLRRANQVALTLLHNRHAGARAVIVGNGPSLRIEDLERLEGTVSFASNKIYLAFTETPWRPDYYSVEDVLVMQNNLEQISMLTGVTKIFPENMQNSGYVAPDVIFVPVRDPLSYQDPLSDPGFPEFCSDLRGGMAWGSTIVYSQIQMAVHMGCREIVLIGLDHAYDHSEARSDGLLVHAGEQNHFHPSYRAKGELWHPPNLDVLEVSYRRAHDWCNAAGIRIVNASRATRLDVFDRVEFDDEFPPNG